MSPISEIQIVLFLLFSAFSISSALIIVNTKSLLYAAFSLVFLGMSTAAAIALLDPEAFAFYSVFHVLLYVGATVTFLVISLVIFKNLELTGEGSRWAIPLTAIFGSLAVIAVLYVGLTDYRGTFEPVQLSLGQVSYILVQQYWFPSLILVVALAATLIEAVTLARRD